MKYYLKTTFLLTININGGSPIYFINQLQNNILVACDASNVYFYSLKQFKSELVNIFNCGERVKKVEQLNTGEIIILCDNSIKILNENYEKIKEDKVNWNNLIAISNKIIVSNNNNNILIFKYEENKFIQMPLETNQFKAIYSLNNLISLDDNIFIAIGRNQFLSCNLEDYSCVLFDYNIQDPSNITKMDGTSFLIWNKSGDIYYVEKKGIDEFEPSKIKSVNCKNINSIIKLYDGSLIISKEPIMQGKLNNANEVFYNGQTFLHEEFGAWLIKEHKVVNIYNQLHIYKHGVYVSGDEDIEKAMIEEIPHLRKTQRQETLYWMKLKTDKMSPADARYIAFTNGILDIVDDQMLPFSPDLVVTNQIPWDYDPDAECDLVDTVFDNIACHDPDIRALLEECIGYCFFRRNELRKAFILTGSKRGGKSTYLDCIKAILGDDNISALDLSEIGDRFNTSMMFGKLANIGDDIGDEFLRGSQVAIFKKVVAGNRIKAEYKGVTPFVFDPYVKLLFSANEIPRMRDRGGAVLDRLIIIPFNAVFDKSQPGYDPFLKYKLVEKEPVQYMIKFGVEGLRRVLADNRGFTKSKAVQQQLAEYNEENNPVLAFIKEQDIEEDILNVPTLDVYRRYTVFCSENGFTAMGNGAFSKQVNNILGTTTRQIRDAGKRIQIFEK